MTPEQSDRAIERRTIAKVTRRLVPFLIACYFVAYLDRVNVGFAALTMNKALGLSATVYGFGAGVFFLTYFLFEVPSNLFLARFGARKWIARIMFTWGLLSAGMAFISGPGGFYAVRMLLGAAEAGFFPGIIFYLTLWFPAQYRARIVGYFMAAIPLSTVIGAPVSSLILGIDGRLGLQGWQWLFLIEAAPALVLSVVTYFYLTDRPADAAWLDADEREWLAGRLAREQEERRAQHSLTVAQALVNPQVLLLSVVYFGVLASIYGLGFFIPQIVKDLGLSIVQTGYVSAVPYVIGAVGMVLWSRHSDRTGERRYHTAIPLFIAAAGLAVSTLTDGAGLKMLALSVAGFGMFAAAPVFWTLPTRLLSGAAAAGGIAWINSVGNLAGFAGPYMMGAMKSATGTYSRGLLTLSMIGILATLITVFMLVPHASSSCSE